MNTNRDLFSKKVPRPKADPWRDVERLQAALEVERSRNRQAHRRFSLELQRQREAAREEREQALRELSFTLQQQKTLELLRQQEALSRERVTEIRRLFRWQRGSLTLGRAKKIAANRHPCAGDGGVYYKLEELLKLLLAGADAEQVSLLQRLQKELNVEKSFYLCHLLEAHGHLQFKRQEFLKKSVRVPDTPESPLPARLTWSGSSESMKKKMPESKAPAAGSTVSDEEESKEGAADEKTSASSASEENMDEESGRDLCVLLRQNAELLRALEETHKTCAALQEENNVLRKSSCPETEEKVKRLRKKNTELSVIAKRLEDRARKLQEANLKVVSAGVPVRTASVEQCKRAFARQRARDLTLHADTLLQKDKQISALQQHNTQLQTQLGQGPVRSSEFERLLKESQKEVLRLQRQLSISAMTSSPINPQAVLLTPEAPLKEAGCHTEERAGHLLDVVETEKQVNLEDCTSSKNREQKTQERLHFLEGELGRKRKECEGLEHEVKKKQKLCLDLEKQLSDEQIRNEQLAEEAELLRRKAQLLLQCQAENAELKEDLCVLGSQHSSVLEENQRLRAKLENLEQVLKHMREVAERRQQLELEQEQALAILKFKQDEIKRLQRAQLFAKQEHEGVVQMLESKVRELEDKCRSQSEQFGMLSHELDKFRVQAAKVDLSAQGLLTSTSLTQLTNGLGLTPAIDPVVDVPAVLRSASTPHAAELSRSSRSPTTRHRELPSITQKSHPETIHLSPRSAASRPSSPRQHSPAPDVDTASEVEDLEVDVSPTSFSSSKAAAKLQVFIARYSYNPYEGPNDSPEVELPLTAGEYIYVYGDMDDDGFYEGELMDGRRGLVPSNFVERVSDDDFLSSHPQPVTNVSHNSFPDSSVHSTSEQHVCLAHSEADITEANPVSAVPLTNGLDLDVEETGLESVPYPRKFTLIKQLAKSIIVGWEAPLVPAGWGSLFSYNVYVDHELRINVPFGTQTKAVLERLDLGQTSYRVAVQSVTDRGSSDKIRCSMLVGRDVCVAPTHLRVERVTATSASLTWLPSNSNYVHIVSLNEEECELVKAGRYSLCLTDLRPGLLYRVQVEARPHRVAWELLPECRERRTTVTSFSTLAAGPPDPPLDVQLEPGPSPGIAQISWLPVTIDAAGTSNGVRVTGYTIYADKKKVLEVSSPTAGSALIGPSQIQTLQVAHELTVRTMSHSGESLDSLPVTVSDKLPAIMSGASHPLCQSVPVALVSANPEPAVCATSLSAAKTPLLPQVVELEEPDGPARGTYVNSSKTSVCEAPLSAATCVEAWTSPQVLPSCASVTGSSVSLPAHVDTAVVVAMPNASEALAGIRASFTTSPPMSTTVPMAAPALTSVPVPTITAVSAPAATPVLLPMSVPLQSSVTPTPPNSARETDSPGIHRPVASLSDFLEDSRAKLYTPPPPPSTSPRVKVPGKDPLDVPDTHPMRPPNMSPFESEPEEDRENTRLVSIEEFLRPTPQPRIKVYAGGRMDPPPDYQGESSRSDLSDILEEEEEDLFSEPNVDFPSCYGTAPSIRSDMWETDSDEDILERIIKLPPQSYHKKQLFSIPEVTEEEDNTESESYSRPCPGWKSSIEGRKRGHEFCQNPIYHRTHKTESNLPVVRHKEPISVRTRPRVHYADTVDTISYMDEEEMDEDSDSSVYPEPEPVCARRMPFKSSRDRLRREVLLKSQMTSGLTPGSSRLGPGSYLLSQTVHRVKSPTGPSTEIDVEYGTDNDEDSQIFDPGEVVLDETSSEWWVEGGKSDHNPLTCRAQPESASRNRSWERSARKASLADPGPPCDVTTKSTHSEVRQHRESRVVGEGDVRIFVALFPYNPVVMSPNPDAAEEELPFTEGQIIKVYGEKDADGFYRGEAAGRCGFVPCNMVSEIQVDDEETREQLLLQGFLSADASTAKADLSRSTMVPRKMVAIFDYDPRESSPNADMEAELTFSAGDVIYTLGDMDDDGFYYGDLNGQKGLVPSNFLQAFPEEEGEAVKPEPTQTEPRKDPPASHTPEQLDALSSATSGAQPDPNLKPVEKPSQTVSAPTNILPLPVSQPEKKKKGFFSKGKRLFRKLGSGKKE